RWCRRQPALAAALGVASAAVAATLVVSVLLAVREYRAAARIRQEQTKTAAALEGSQRLAANLALDQALGLCERGDVGRGLLWLVHSLELSPKGATELRRAIVLNLGGWRTQMRAQRHLFAGPDLIRQVGFHPDGRRLLTGFTDGT